MGYTGNNGAVAGLIVPHYDEPMNNPAMLVRPSMPTQADAARVELTEAVHLVLDEQWDEILNEWVEAHVGKERLAGWGPVDTSVNDLSDLCRQLSTPGLYGYRPELSHPSSKADPLIGQGGWLDVAGWAPKLQHVQYMTLGLGDYLIRPHVSDDDELSMQLVSPHLLYTEAAPDHPDKPLALWYLRLRYWKAAECWLFAWDVYDTRPGQERWQVLAASDGGKGQAAFKAGDDLSNIFLAKEGVEFPEDGYTGEAYPWREDGKAYLPWAVYRSVDTGRAWNHLARRGAYRGTLNSALLSTYTNQSARDATGSAVIAAGLEPITGTVQGVGTEAQITTVILKPGAILYHQAIDGQQPFIKEVGPGANLPVLAAYSREYSTRILTRFGLSPTDVTRQSANPSSAAALVVSDRGRRDYSRQVEPLFRRADLDLISLIARMYNMLGHDLPTDGYSITYRQIPDSPQEARDKRDDLDWELDHGLKSRIEVYQERHPGASREAAVQALSRVQADELAIEAETARLQAERAEEQALLTAAAPGTDTDTDDDDDNEGADEAA